MFLDSNDGRRKSKCHDFTIDHIPEIVLDSWNKTYYLALYSAEMTYSWFNVSSKYKNNKIKYSNDSGVNWVEIVFRDGNFSYSDINEYISQTLEVNGDLNAEGKGITLTFSSSLLKVYIELEENDQLDLREGDFSKLICFNKEIVTSTKYGSNTPNITRNVDNIFIHCNLLSDSRVSGKQGDVLYRFSVANLQISYPFEIKETIPRPLFNKINTNIIKELRIYITDGLNNPLDLNDIPINLTLLLKEVLYYILYLHMRRIRKVRDMNTGMSYYIDIETGEHVDDHQKGEGIIKSLISVAKEAFTSETAKDLAKKNSNKSC